MLPLYLDFMSDGRNGTVVRTTGGWSSVLLEGGNIIDCRLRGSFRTKGIRSTNPVTVGDHVSTILDDDGQTGVITDISPRRNYIIRKSVNLSRESHIIAANIDQALLIMTLKQPRTSFGFIDRFLATSEAYRIPAVVVINKTDLYTDPEDQKLLETTEEVYRSAGYTVLLVSALSGEGLNALKELMKERVSLISGHSGVGKSTLINAIEPGLKLKTSDISIIHEKGRHTTTFSEMLPLSFGGAIIDTPGIKEFGLIDIERNELSHFFPEIFRHAEHCRFHNCLHLNEPGCAVKQASENGSIAETRYSNYITILETIP